MSAGTDDDEEIRILDERGCLTLEAMCFSNQLQSEQRAVVERHVRNCVVCAQQQMDLAAVTERVRGARPRVPVPVEAKALARQVALRSLSVRRAHREGRRRRPTARLRVVGRRAAPWYRSGVFWAATLIGLATAFTVAVIALLLL
jgi:hypothetical protein